MGARWESVLFRSAPEVSQQLAERLADVVLRAVDPIQVQLHFMYGVGPLTGLVSAELTSFAKKPLAVRPEAVASISAAVFADRNLAFRSCEIVLAERISREVGETLYVALNDTYNSAGYVWFKQGHLRGFELVGWEGTNTHVVDQEVGIDESRQDDQLLTRAFDRLGWRPIASFQDLFDGFYGDAAKALSYLVMDRRMPVSPPREV